MQRYRPLVLEMKEWPDAFTWFSRGPSNVVDNGNQRQRKITFCELCEVRVTDLQEHLKSTRHITNAKDSKKWEGVDALISKMPTVNQLIESKIKQRNLSSFCDKTHCI